MNSNNILDMVGDAKGTYVWDAQSIRSGAVPVTKKKASSKRTLLIAAIIALMLLLVGCTVAYVQGWFVDFFSMKSEIPLSDSQITLIEQNEQHVNEVKNQNGWTIELRSVLNDNNTKYKGDYGVMFTHEETQRIKKQEVLVEGTWVFTITFTTQDPVQEKGELLTAPIKTTVEIPWRYGENLWNVADVRKEITVTSILLEPFSVKVSYEPLRAGAGPISTLMMEI